VCLEERPRRGEEGGSPFISGCCRIAQDGGSMLTTTMSLNWANTTAQLVLRPASLRTHKAAAVSVVPLTCTRSPKKGADRQTRDRAPQPGFSDCAALEGLEPGEPNCNSPLPSRMVDEHHRQPVCTTVAVTKRWHGEVGVWRIARHVCSTEADGDATTFSPAHHRQKKHHGRQHWRDWQDWQDLHASTH
jgi:hypothetical protein